MVRMRDREMMGGVGWMDKSYKSEEREKGSHKEIGTQVIRDRERWIWGVANKGGGESGDQCQI